MASIPASPVSTDAHGEIGEAATRAAAEPRSRRSLLAGAVAGVAATIAAALGRPAATDAAAGSPLIVGSEANNAGTSNTQLIANSDVVTFKLYQQGPGTALMGYTTTVTGLTRGVYGRVDSPNGDGVQGRNAGTAGTGAGVRAYGGLNTGVHATTDTADSMAIIGENLAATGGGAIGIRGKVNVTDAAFGDAFGVYGLAAAGHAGGTLGFANGDGPGVSGYSNTGPGIYGDSGTGQAGYFKGKVLVKESSPYIELDEYSPQMDFSPPVAPTYAVRLFAKHSAGGKVQLCAIFPTGAAIVIATEA